MSHNDRVDEIRRMHSDRPVVHLVRRSTGIEGTFGRIHLPGKILSSVELPWRDNQKFISCTPYGEYECEIVDSPRYGKVYQVKNVPNRWGILFHVGNFGADRGSGLRSDLLGCVGLGMRVGQIYGQRAVASSRDAMDQFHKIMAGEPFTLIVSGFLPMGVNKDHYAS